MLLAWRVRTCADVLPLRPHFHNRLWTAACWGDGKPNRGHAISRKRSTILRAEAWGHGQSPGKKFFFQQTFPVRLYAGHCVAMEMEAATRGLSLWPQNRSNSKNEQLLWIWRSEGREEIMVPKKGLWLLPGFHVHRCCEMKRNTCSIEGAHRVMRWLVAIVWSHFSRIKIGDPPFRDVHGL